MERTAIQEEGPARNLSRSRLHFGQIQFLVSLRLSFSTLTAQSVFIFLPLPSPASQAGGREYGLEERSKTQSDKRRAEEIPPDVGGFHLARVDRGLWRALAAGKLQAEAAGPDVKSGPPSFLRAATIMVKAMSRLLFLPAPPASPISEMSACDEIL